MASDDPEGWSWYERIVRRAGEDYDIHVLSNLNGVGNIEVNAFQRAARVVIQKSTREGFGLVVSEALWKGRPVVAGNVGGIPLQIVDGETGFSSARRRTARRRSAGCWPTRSRPPSWASKGIEFVRDKFLTTRYLRDYLSIFGQLAGSSRGAEAPHSPAGAPIETEG